MDFYHLGKLESFGRMKHRLCKEDNNNLADKIEEYCKQNDITWFYPSNAYVAEMLVKIRFKSATSKQISDYNRGRQ